MNTAKYGSRRSWHPENVNFEPIIRGLKRFQAEFFMVPGSFSCFFMFSGGYLPSLMVTGWYKSELSAWREVRH